MDGLGFASSDRLRGIRARVWAILIPVVLVAPLVVAHDAAGAPATRTAIVTTYEVSGSRGVLATSGGWAYCYQARPIARRLHYTLVCGRYVRDGYTGFGLRANRWVDWGNPRYLDELAASIAAVHRRIGGPLVLAGVSYSGYGVAVLAASHPELRPDRVIVVDSYLDLVARRAHLPATHESALEIDRETGGTADALALRSPSVSGLAQLVRGGTKLVVVWSIAARERKEFSGATCDASANAGRLSALARLLGQPVDAWVTQSRHGVTFWDFGVRLVKGGSVGTRVTFEPDGRIPAGAICV
jgi:pimeloyl-ACP methyl ester carboxylesterase